MSGFPVKKYHSAGRYFLGLIIIFFGLASLLEKLGYINLALWKKEYFLPILTIYIGLSMLGKGKKFSGPLGIILGFGVIAILLHVLTGGSFWSKFY